MKGIWGGEGLAVWNFFHSNAGTYVRFQRRIAV
jgi:hypothetical protein